LAHDAADSEANIIFGSLIDENVQDEVKITIIATGFVSRESKASRVPVQVQAPLQPRLATPIANAPTQIAPAAANAPRPEEVATLVPAKAGARTLPAEPPRTPAPRPPPPNRESLPLDEDQFDIPTFLRRQGHTELP